jgi:hypothetical protein
MRLTTWSRLAATPAWRIGLGSASIVLSALCGCSWNDVFLTPPPTILNGEAVDRALQLCSLSAGDQPFHLVLAISPPGNASDLNSGRFHADFRAQLEIYWLNPITYRTEIRSARFSQTRIVNGRVVEEHNTGDFYPRWIQNFVEAILEPIPEAGQLRKVPGSVPVGVKEHACIAGGEAQVCFQDAEPRIATGSGPTRSVWFDNFAPLGKQQIARTIVDKLPGDLLVRGHILLLTPLSQWDYKLLKATEFTLPEKLIQTELVSQSTAESWMQIPPADFRGKLSSPLPAKGSSRLTPSAPVAPRSALDTSATVYIRTDKTGNVREAYVESSSGNGAQYGAVARALAMHFKPLVVDGAPRQMEATVVVP